MMTRLRTLFVDQRGAAMTEFVIALPIYIAIFAGMGSLYQLHHAGMQSMGEAHRNLWEEAANPSVEDLSPLSVLGDISDTSDFFVTGVNGLGIYKDSYAKTVLLQAIPGAPGVDPVVHSVEEIGGFGSNAHSKRLLDDFYDISGFQTNSGVTGMFMAAVGALGMSLGAGAGIRYGAHDGEAQNRQVETIFGSYTIAPGKLSLPANTAATHRIVAVGQTRLQHSTDDVFDESILNFDWDLNLDGPPDLGTVSGASNVGQAGACATQARNYGNCITPLLQAGIDPEIAEFQCRNLKPAGNCAGVGGTNIPNPSPENCTQFGLPPELCKVK